MNNISFSSEHLISNVFLISNVKDKFFGILLEDDLLYNPFNYKYISIQFHPVIKFKRTKRITKGVIINFNTSQDIYNLIIHYLREKLVKNSPYNINAITSVLDEIEKSLSKKKKSKEKYIGLIGEFYTLSEFLKVGIDLTGQYQSVLFETLHDINADNFVIEVKTTTSNEEIHLISNYDQIDTKLTTKSIYICSVIIQQNHEGKTLNEIFALICSKLPDEQKIQFERKVKFLYSDYLEYTEKYKLVRSPKFTEAQHIPQPSFDKNILSIQWQFSFNNIHGSLHSSVNNLVTLVH